jgi:hypothetical protein
MKTLKRILGEIWLGFKIAEELKIYHTVGKF